MTNSDNSTQKITSVPIIHSNRFLEKGDFETQNEFDCVLKVEWHGTADMDLSCVGFTPLGAFVDAAYYNRKHDAFETCVQHLGDSRFDNKQNLHHVPDELKNTMTSKEQLHFKLGSIKPSVSVLSIVMTCFEGSETKKGNWSDTTFMNTQVRVPGPATRHKNLENGDWMIEKQNTNCAGNHQALIVGYFYRSEEMDSNETKKNWVFHSVMKPVNHGRVFVDVVPEIRKNMGNENIIDPILLEECKWSAKVPKTFNLQKEERFELPNEMNRIFVGLGWDSICDLDSSVIPFDDEGLPIFTEMVTYANDSKRGIQHHGDNTTGEGEGDDEIIEIDLNRIRSDIHTLLVVVNVYSSGYTFQNVSGAFFRLVDQSSSQEVCRYNLQKMGESLAMIMCKLERSSPLDSDFEIHDSLKQGHGKWVLTCLGDPCLGDEAEATANSITPLPYERVTVTMCTLDIQIHAFIIEGKDLVACDRNGFSDPYVQVIYGDEQKKTSVQKKTLNPEWNEELTFHISTNFEDDQGDFIEIQKRYVRDKLGHVDFRVFDHDRITKDDAMGCIRFNFDEKSFIDKMLDFQTPGIETEDSGEQEIELKPIKNEKVSGSIKISIKMIKTLNVESELLYVRSRNETN